MTLLTDQAAWRQLEAHYAGVKRQALKRTDRFALEMLDLAMDYSRNHLDDKSLRLFSELADASDLSGAINRLMSGEIVNFSEQRAAWHTILRDPDEQPDDIRTCYEKIRECEAVVHEQGITDVIHVGIGGSYLGPRFLFDAFSSITDPTLHCHFIANQDPVSLQNLLQTLNPEKTLVIVVSKSFTTIETMTNATPIRDWLQSELPKNWKEHVLAVTAAFDRAIEWGVSSIHVFPMWDWVGGRFSLWSAVSLSLVFAFGWPMFDALLSGAHEMDQHFQSQAWSSNLPVMLAFIGLLYRHFFDAQTQAIIPYHNALTRLPSHLQQLHMESLGKQVTQLGNPIDYPTGAVIWGGTGPGSQHSFHQLLLQGRDLVPIDFIALRENDNAYQNCFSQAEALLSGNRDEDVPSYQRLLGNRPSTIITMNQLTPENLGALLAMYEHKVYTQAVLWNINPFDQWGVEAGKRLFRDASAQSETEGSV